MDFGPSEHLWLTDSAHHIKFDRWHIQIDRYDSCQQAMSHRLAYAHLEAKAKLFRDHKKQNSECFMYFFI